MTDVVVPQLLTVAEAAAILRVSIPRLYQLARMGSVPSVRLVRQLRFSRDALASYIARGGCPASQLSDA